MRNNYFTFDFTNSPCLKAGLVRIINLLPLKLVRDIEYSYPLTFLKVIEKPVVILPLKQPSLFQVFEETFIMV